ncbi:MAG: DUF3662 and FHA domain-containing protein [Acidimicrobiia bacterium]|nr:DUF3662 and FHA domain-containing protein [Acidimicrobiia bacterium]
MKLVRDFERRLEQLVDGMAGKVFRGKLHPVELASRLVREADLGVEESPIGPTAPNIYSLRVNPRGLDTDVPSDLIRELEEVLESTAADRGWRLGGPVRVSLETAEGVSPGTVDCRVDRSPGRRLPWAFLVDERGSRLAVVDNRCLIGRAETCDITIGHPGVSRTHALLWRESGEVWVSDLGSANGTEVDGSSSHSPLLLSAGGVLALGPVELTFNEV